ncbi:MAG: aminotransferase class I/II-fold pyridoxal phosphate-dependent enzyme [Bacteriovoracaceae bacterium]
MLSDRILGTSDSITMKLNEKALSLTEEGRVIYNLSGGQLPIKPMSELTEKIHHQLNFLKSYQYPPSAGFNDLREKFLKVYAKKRNLEAIEALDCIVSNGSKHSLYNALGVIINPGDEVITLAPYWVSYPEMIKFWGGVTKVVKSNVFDAFTPAIDDIRRALTPKTKAIIINSPNNPAGIHYSHSWMKEFAILLTEFPNLIVISDEAYSDICYYDPKPTYFYQYDPELLERTIIVDSISKSLAATGLRIGFTIAPESVVEAMKKLQSQTTSGANSLIQRALIDFNFDTIDSFLIPVRNHIRLNATFIQQIFREYKLSHCWYQSTSAFYFMVDFSRTSMFEKFDQEKDNSYEVADKLLEEGVLVVPGKDFGMPNSLRISLVLEEIPFQEAIIKLLKFLTT